MKSVQLPLEKILSCLSLIERSVPNIDNFSLYTPSDTFDPHDVISIQREAKRMMEFIGLRGYTTTVTLCSTDNGTSGNINLNDSYEVFIEIDGDMKNNRRKYKEAVLCVMAHEICHKYLYSHGLYLKNTNSNEYCTDLATFFVGFGLLTINGCYEQYTTTTTNINGGETTTTHTFSTGYLTPENYLTAHQVVCKVHNISSVEGVNSEMLRFSSAFNKNLIQTTLPSREAILEKFKEQSTSLANRKREIMILKRILEQKEKEMISEYEKIDYRFNRLILYGNSVERFPYAAMHILNLPQNANPVSEFTIMNQELAPIYKNILDDSLRTLTCPFCGTVANDKIKENGLSIRKCQCGKIFYWDARTIDDTRQNPEIEKDENKVVKKRSFIFRIKELFRLKNS